MDFFGELLTTGTGLFLLLALGLAFSFEFINGFHDTANTVATVIYTNALKPTVAVIWSGIWNSIGVLVSSGAVAFGIVSLLPVELVLNVGSGAGFAMVFALLISAIAWNLGTWYLGLPVSSSHALIGSIMGVGFANSILSPDLVFGEGVNWTKIQEVFASLLISPIVGFCCTALLLLLAKAFIKLPELYCPSKEQEVPPPWIRFLLILTCTGVSYAHGSNDGQKGMGLIVLILIGILPGTFALNANADAATIYQLLASSQAVTAVFEQRVPTTSANEREVGNALSSFLKTNGNASDETFIALAETNRAIADKLTGKLSFKDIAREDCRSLRSNIYLVSETISKLSKANEFTNETEKEIVLHYKKQLERVTDFIPAWVKLAVAVSLGLGTTIGWKRVVVTVGEKIGKDHLSYAQGASAELVTMGTIAVAGRFGLPVSTTHILSSGIAGTMVANRSGVQANTVRNLLLAWVLTLPACMLLGAIAYATGLYAVLHFSRA